MQNINSATELRAAILLLEGIQADKGKMLREQFHLAYDSIKPINLIKSTFKEAAVSRDLKDNILNTSIGLTTGYLSKILFEGVSKNPLKRLFGSVLMFGITNLVTKNPETVKTIGQKFLNALKSKPGEHVNGSGGSQPR